MKTVSPLIKILAAAPLSAALVFATACSKTRDTTSASTATTTTATEPSSSTATSGSAMTASAPDSWDALKGYSYEQRNDFASKANEYANRLDTSLTTAKGAAAARITEARDALRTAASEANHATAETWDATKDRIGRAWQQADSAVRSAAE